MNGLAIEKETFDGMDIDSRLSVLFDLSQDTHKRVAALGNRKRVDRAYSVMGGFFGGFAALAGKMILWK